MKHLFFLFFFLNNAFAVSAQKYMTKNGYIGFFSHTPMEDIKGDNNQVADVLDISTGEMVTGGINANSKFNIVPGDYKINIQGVVREKISKNLEVTVAMKYAPLENK